MSLPMRPGRVPRAAQVACFEAVREGFKHYSRILASMATGGGKGDVAAGISAAVAAKGRRCLVLTDRTELVEDLHERCGAVAGRGNVGLVMRDRDEWGAQIVVASSQSVTPRRFDRMGAFGLVIQDECFPGDVLVTLADGRARPIADVRVGDLVAAVDARGAVRARRVVHLFRSTPSALVKVVTSRGSVTCTPGHPFLTARGWVAAADLTPNDLVRRFDANPQRVPGVSGGEGSDPSEVLSHLPGTPALGAAGVHHGAVPGLRPADGGAGRAPTPDGATGSHLLLGRLPGGGHPGPRVERHGADQSHARLGADDGAEPHALAGLPRAHGGDAAPDRARTQRPRRERARPDAGGSPAVGGVGLADQRHRQDGAGDEVGIRAAEPLQARRREPSVDGGDRGGRWQPRLPQGQGRRPPEGGVLAWARVDRVEVLQRGGDGTAPGGVGDGLVYNIEVERDHTYVAAGFVVHNCHHATSPSHRRIYDRTREDNPAVKLLGLTATPFRTGKDGMTEGLGDIFEALVFEHSVADAIEAGDLVPVRGYQVRTDLDLSAVALSADGDYDPAALARVVDTEPRNRLVVDQYLERGQGRPTLVFAATVEHAQHLADAFRARGINAEAVWGNMPASDRRFRVRAFREHPEHLPVLISVALLFEGFDAPRTSLLLKARPTRSPILFQQLVGRGLRTVGMPGHLVDPAERRAWIASSSKPECVFVDLVDNGCALTLDTMADLSPSDPESDTKARPLVVGDRVTRRHHANWGCGWVLAVTDSAVLPRVEVRWPPSDVHAAGTVSVHARPELQWVPGEAAPDEEPAPLLLPAPIAGIRVYELVGLMGAARTPRMAWYREAGTYTVDGLLPRGGRIAVHVRAAGSGFEVWEVLTVTTGPDRTEDHVASLKATRSPVAAALTWAEEHLRALQAEVPPADSPWRRAPASGAQLGKLRALGRHRDSTGMSAGEASSLIAFAVCTRAIRKAEDPARFERAEAVRKHYRRQARDRRAGGAA